MIRDDIPNHFQDDVAFAFGEEGAKLWKAYGSIRERLTSEVDAGKHPTLDAKEVGTLHRLVKDFQIDDPMDFRMALKRITVDKDYYGFARIGMGDLLAIRSIESHLVFRVEYKINQALQERPLIREVVGNLRHLKHSRGITHDIRLAEQAVSACLSAVLSLSSDGGGDIKQSEVMELAFDNGIRNIGRPE